MDNLQQLGPATHLRGARVKIVDAAHRHAGKEAFVVGRSRARGVSATNVILVSEDREGRPQMRNVLIPQTQDKEFGGHDGALERIHITIKDPVAEREKKVRREAEQHAGADRLLQAA